MKTELTDGAPVPADRSHTELRADGQQKGYVVLSAEERAKGFVKPVRTAYIHQTCGAMTSMGRSLAETYARDPNFYSGTFCVGCAAHFPLDQFKWEDGEPMEPTQQQAWADEQAERLKQSRLRRYAELQRELRELEKLL